MPSSFTSFINSVPIMEVKDKKRHGRSTSDGQSSCFGKKKLRRTKSQTSFEDLCKKWEESMWNAEEQAKKGECLGLNGSDTTS